MMRRSLLALLLPLLVVAAPAAAASPTFHLRRITALDGAREAVHLAAPKGDPRLFVVERQGRVLVLDRGKVSTFLDITADVESAYGERGLLSIAFHPGFATNGRFFVYYTAKGPGHELTVAEFDGSGKRAAASSRAVWASIDHHQAPNHNGGQLAFGPDGKLWLGTGDGGDGGDSQGHAQDRGSLLGKLLTIDVDAPGAHPVIRAVGVRNPWRFSFDRERGTLWVGDVGQDRFEEIDRIDTRRPGLLNLGWGRFEGRSLFNGGRTLTGGRLLWPIAVIPHPHGEAVIGGFVYRGSVRALRGWYLYADNAPADGAGPWIRGLRPSGHPHFGRFERTRGIPPGITSFGEGGTGEVYVVSYGGVFRIVR
jgi:hypothetical protein